MIDKSLLDKDWKENQRSSEEKWREIRNRVKNKKPFYNSFGWCHLVVAEPCGYCEQFYFCSLCILSFDNFCFMVLLPETVFWQFVLEMQKPEPDFRRALALATKMLMRIREDRPSLNPMSIW